jgi:predicted lactoylglutathione lyase
MQQMIFVNLPVANVAASTAFYEAIGFRKDERFCDASGSCMVLSDTICVMALSRERFADFTKKEIVDPKTQVQTLLCISRDNREAVDAIVDSAVAAGGSADPGPKQDMGGFMYGRSFEDLDGHVWEPMWMDVAAFEKMMAGGGQVEPA